MLKPIAAIAALGLAGAAGYMVNASGSPARSIDLFAAPASATAEVKSTKSDQHWIAAAPGRIEPKTGEIHIAAGIMGRIDRILVKVNDEVVKGEAMIRLDDREARARLAAAEAEAAARQKQRDAAGKTTKREAINDAEDAVYAAERALTGARFSLDEALFAKRNGTGSISEVDAAQKRHDRAKSKLQRERISLALAQSKSDIPLPQLVESALSRARAEVAAADAVLAKTRIRASVAATVLRLDAKPGEMVAPGPAQSLVTIGDTSMLRVKAEVDEGDVAKIELGQKVTVRSPSHPGRKFAGTVAMIAPSLAQPRIGPRGPRRATDVEVLEVTVDLDKGVPLLPGLKVDAFFNPADK